MIRFGKITAVLAGSFAVAVLVFFNQDGKSFKIEADSAKKQSSIINNSSGTLSVSESAKQTDKSDGQGKSFLSGAECENYNRRPIAVMLAGDVIVRPLSGLSLADLVVEMPVITDSITRLMAVFVCNDPSEIGSIRSSRHDFITLAQGFDAIYAHWGGSHFALDRLKKSGVDNIDALSNPYQSFYRKDGILPPHNGFSSMERLLNASKKLNYRLENKFEGYLHIDLSPVQDKSGILEVGFVGPYKVKYQYNPKTNAYLRFRGGTPEIDKLTGRQIEAKNVVIVRADSRQIEGQYNDVDIEGRGKAAFYRNGEELIGYWEKDESDYSSKLYFFDENGEIKFVPGQIWIEVVEPSQDVTWKIQ